VWRIDNRVTSRGKDGAELVDGVGGFEREAEMQKPRRMSAVSRTSTVARPLEQLRANAAEVERAAPKVGRSSFFAESGS
jgi:hypothetical protein